LKTRTFGLQVTENKPGVVYASHLAEIVIIPSPPADAEVDVTITVKADWLPELDEEAWRLKLPAGSNIQAGKVAVLSSAFAQFAERIYQLRAEYTSRSGL